MQRTPTGRSSHYEQLLEKRASLQEQKNIFDSERDAFFNEYWNQNIIQKA
jgi:hypothetical protein